MLFVFNITKDMDPKNAYAVSAGLIGIITLMTLFMVKEPTDVTIEKPSCARLLKLIKKSIIRVCTRREVALGYLFIVFINSD